MDIHKIALFSCLLGALTPAHAINNCAGDAKTNHQRTLKAWTRAINFYKYDGVTANAQVEDNRTGELASVGIIQTPYTRSLGAQCTGFALVHPQIVVTNAHCFFKSTTDAESVRKMNSSVDFQPGVYQGIVQETIPGNLAMVGTTNHGARPADDYAVIVLKYPVKSQPIPAETKIIPTKDLVAATYSIDDQTHGDSLTFVAGCTSNGSDARLLNHFCSASSGGSGGLIGVADMVRDKNGRLLEANNIRAVGIHVRELAKNGKSQVGVVPNKGNENYAVPIANVLPSVNYAIQQLKNGVPWNKIE